MTYFAYTMTQAITQEMPFVITAQTGDKTQTFYYDKVFSSLEEAITVCRGIAREAKLNGFIEISASGHPTHSEYVFQPYTHKTEFHVIHAYNEKMEKEYDEEMENNNEFLEQYYAEEEEYYNNNQSY